MLNRLAIVVSYLCVFLLQKRHFFRVKNKESGHFLSVQGGVEELKSGRVVAAAEVEPLSDIWFYQEGRIKNKVSVMQAHKHRRLYLSRS